jgi:hypothetical protein
MEKESDIQTNWMWQARHFFNRMSRGFLIVAFLLHFTHSFRSASTCSVDWNTILDLCFELYSSVEVGRQFYPGKQGSNEVEQTYKTGSRSLTSARGRVVDTVRRFQFSLFYS